MTGEVSLNGKVLRVGGIKEKVLGARRAGVNCIIMPEENRCDWEELEDVLRDGINIHFVTRYEEVFPILFEDLDLAKLRAAPGSSSSQSSATDGEITATSTSAGAVSGALANPSAAAATPSSAKSSSTVEDTSMWQSVLRWFTGSQGKK